MALNVAVIGLGLIGGSLARAASAGGAQVTGWDLDESTRTAAAQAEIDVVGKISEFPIDTDLIVLAVPLVAMPAVTTQVKAHFGEDSTITDVGSTKAPVVDAIRKSGLTGRYVGAHPMAGTEFSGFDASSAELMQGVKWAVTLQDLPDDASSASHRHLLRVLEFITMLDGTALVLTEDFHDEVVALVSHAPHVLATALLGLVARTPVSDVAVALAAGSFRDGTRVARTDVRRTKAMVETNAGWVAPATRALAMDLLRFADDLESHAPTDWFFDKPEPLRGVVTELGDKKPVRVTWAGPWRQELLTAGRESRSVIAVDGDGAWLAG